MYKTNELFDLSKTRAADLLRECEYPWQALDKIGETILKIGAALSSEEFSHPKEDVWIAKDAVVYPTAWINGPCIIDSGAEVRHGAFIRGNALVGKKLRCRQFGGAEKCYSFRQCSDSAL